MKIEFKEKLNVLEEYVINVFPLILSSKLIPHSPINFSSTFDTSLIFDRASHFSIHPCSFLAPLSINFNTYTAAHSKQINSQRRQRFFIFFFFSRGTSTASVADVKFISLTARLWREKVLRKEYRPETLESSFSLCG